MAQLLKNKLKSVLDSVSSSFSSDDMDPPGPALVQLAALTFGDDSARMCELIVDYLVNRLRPSSSPKGTLKTLKALFHLAKDGSRAYRVALRTRDDALKAVAEHTTIRIQGDEGTSTTESMKQISYDIRNYIFDETVLMEDNSLEPEVRPREQARYSGGMGASAALTEDSKYEGFGNTTSPPESLGGKAIEILGSLLNPQDDRIKVMQACLKSDTGDYKPVGLPSSILEAHSAASKHTAKLDSAQTSSRKHVPGRAGGGWDAADAEVDQLKFMASLSAQSKSSSSSSVLEADESSFQELEKPSENSEYILLREFCTKDGMPRQFEIDDAFNRALDLNILTFLYEVNRELTKPNETNDQIRMLLLVERMLRSKHIKFEVYKTILSETLAKLQEGSENPVKFKAKKIALTIDRLQKDYHYIGTF